MLPFISKKTEAAVEQPKSESSATSSTPLSTFFKNIIRVDLNDYGYKKAGDHRGSANALANLLNDIRNGFIIDVNEDEEAQRAERARKEQEIDELRLQISGKEAALKTIRAADIPAAEAEIARLKQQMHEADIEKEKKKAKIKTEGYRSSFDLYLYWPIFVMATLFLYGFYVSAFYTAFFMDIAQAASQADANNISALFNTVFNIKAFTELQLHWLAPTIFFVFALVLHIIFDGKSKYRSYLLAGILLFILLADCLLAYFIEYNSHTIMQLNGLAEEDWTFYTSPRFYLVLFLGYFTCLGWSMILYAIKEELFKEDPERMAELVKQGLQRRIDELTLVLENLKKQAIQIEGEIAALETKIEQFKAQLDRLVFSKSDLDKRITAFYDGWLRYLNALKDGEALTEACEAVIRSFKEVHLQAA